MNEKSRQIRNKIQAEKILQEYFSQKAKYFDNQLEGYLNWAKTGLCRYKDENDNDCVILPYEIFAKLIAINYNIRMANKLLYLKAEKLSAEERAGIAIVTELSKSFDIPFEKLEKLEPFDILAEF